MIVSLQPQSLKNMIANAEVFLIDVRVPAMHSASNIQGSLNMPYSEIDSEIIKAKNIDNKKIVLYCNAGVKSMAACTKLLEQDPGIVVYNLENGLNAWLRLTA